MTVVMVGVLALAVAVCLVAARLGAAAVTSARADAAADAAALAAADLLALGRGEAAATAAARATAAANGARLVECRCHGSVAAVTVVLDAGVGGSARATARAEVREECRFGCQSRASMASRVTAPTLSRYSFQLPHLGDCTQDGQPSSHGHSATVSRAAARCSWTRANESSAIPAPPG